MLTVIQLFDSFTGQQRAAEGRLTSALAAFLGWIPYASHGPSKHPQGLDLVNTIPSFQMTKDALVYSTFLLHDPRPVSGLSILRTNRVEVPIECRYPRSVRVVLAGFLDLDMGACKQDVCSDRDNALFFFLAAVMMIVPCVNG
jgi:hypothetical protein